MYMRLQIPISNSTRGEERLLPLLALTLALSGLVLAPSGRNG